MIGVGHGVQGVECWNHFAPTNESGTCNSRLIRGPAVRCTLDAMGLYFGADLLLDRIERARGARFQNRQAAFLAIIRPLAVIAFGVMRRLRA